MSQDIFRYFLCLMCTNEDRTANKFLDLLYVRYIRVNIRSTHISRVFYDMLNKHLYRYSELFKNISSFKNYQLRIGERSVIWKWLLLTRGKLYRKSYAFSFVSSIWCIVYRQCSPFYGLFSRTKTPFLFNLFKRGKPQNTVQVWSRGWPVCLVSHAVS